MKKLLIALLFTFVSTGAYADGHSPCGVTDGSIKILANEFTTYRIFMDEVKSCAGPDADFSVTHSVDHNKLQVACLLYTSPSPRDRQKSRMPSSA